MSKSFPLTGWIAGESKIFIGLGNRTFMCHFDSSFGEYSCPFAGGEQAGGATPQGVYFRRHWPHCCHPGSGCWIAGQRQCCSSSGGGKGGGIWRPSQ